MTVDEIGELNITKLVVNLRNWQPGKESMDSSPEGLSRNLSEAIKKDVDKYKHSASSFKELSPAYIRGLFQGFKEGISQLDQESWSEIIDLSEWVLSQEDSIKLEIDMDSGEDPSWS